MKIQGTLAAALAAVLLGAAPRPAPLTVYSAPAKDRPAGASRLAPVDAVLPNGRTAAPLGVSAFVGTNPLGVAVSPDGRYAIVTNDEQDATAAGAPPDQALRPGYSLAVVDTATMRVASVFQSPNVSFFEGVAAVTDPIDRASTLVLASDGANNVVRLFRLSGGVLRPLGDALAVSGFPASIDVSSDGRIAYVTSNIGNAVTALDLVNRRVLGRADVGFNPLGVASNGRELYVVNSGLDVYGPLAQPQRVPAFANVAGNPYRTSSLSVLSLDTTGDLAGASGVANVVRLDPIPDGVTTIGGARPGSVVLRRDGAFAYVTLSNVDRVATVALGASPRVVGGLDIRLFVTKSAVAPYGTQPDAQVLSRDGKRLYVALAGLDAVAVLDSTQPATLHRLGLIPTGAFPSALALSPDGRYLYVTSARGVDGWGLLQRVDLKTLPLREATLSALRYNRDVSAATPNSVVPPLRSKKASSTIDRVVYIGVGGATYDALFGDLGRGDADPQLSVYPQSQTPNLHALARAYAVADDFYVDDMNADLNRQYALGGAASAYAQRVLHVNAGRAPYDAHGDDPEEYTRAGYLFNALSRAGMSFRDYGGLMQLSGYQPALARSAQGRGRPAQPIDPHSLGGSYTLGVPALAALDGRVDLTYPGWNPQISNATRAAEFIADMQRAIASDAQPAFTYVWLPDAGGATMADADRAVGSIVGFLSRTPHWSSTAVFIVADGTGGSTDHVNRARAFALVVSPLAKQGYVGHRHLSVASVVKTEEELLGLDPIALNDLLATDMADFFGDVPYPNSYQPIP